MFRLLQKSSPALIGQDTTCIYSIQQYKKTFGLQLSNLPNLLNVAAQIWCRYFQVAEKHHLDSSKFDVLLVGYICNNLQVWYPQAIEKK